MEYKLFFSAAAKNDLDEIFSYMAVKLVNPSAATRFAERVESAIERSICFPESGQLILNRNIKRKDVRKVIIDNYMLIYYPDNDSKTIYIARIIYEKRDTDTIFNDIDFLMGTFGK